MFLPSKAANLAAEFDIKVYCIGAGTNGLAPTPVVDMFGRTRLGTQQVEIDEETLKEIAELTGGNYYRAENREGLAEIYGEIDALERTEVSEVRYLSYTEYFPLFVLVAIAITGVAIVSSSTLFRRLP